MPTKLSESELAEIRERVEQATAGPWSAQDLGPCDGWQITSLAIGLPNDLIASDGADLATEDADFITHARTDIPALLDHITALEGELKAAQDKMLSQVSVMKQYGVDEVNNFRAQLVEAVRRMQHIGDFQKQDVIQLIQTFELEK